MDTKRFEKVIHDNALYALRLKILGSDKLTDAERLCFDMFILIYMEENEK